MKIPVFIFLITGGAVSAVAQSATPPSDLVTSPKRNVTVELARSLLTTKTYNEDAELKNPFQLAPPPPAPVVATSGVVAPPEPTETSDRARLEELAKQVTPSGFIQLSGVPILLFGQKKLKVGDTYSITFEGKPYELQITEIERTSFKLRLNNEEITRPIKHVPTKP